MKSNILFVLIFLIASFGTSCQKENLQSQESQYCSSVTGGNISLKINGKDWSSNCVNAIQVTINIENNFSKTITIFGINNETTFFEDGNLEVFNLSINEHISDGQAARTVAASFMYNLLDINEAATNINISEGLFYHSTGTESNMVTYILTDELVEGTLNFLLEEEDSGDQILISGDFSAFLEK